MKRQTRSRLPESKALLPWASGALAGVTMCALLAVHLIPAGLELVVRQVEGREEILRVPIEPGGRFTLHYIHSVDMAPIWEEHSVDEEGSIYIEEERFEMFGAGMGHWEGHGTLTRRGKYQVIENIHERIGSFVLRVGDKKTRHTLLIGDLQVDLSRKAAGRAVLVSVVPINLLEHLFRAPLEMFARNRTVVTE